jgi:hypothetical protein
VELSGDQFLSDAAFPLEQDREIGQRHPFDGRAKRLHDGARSDERCGAIAPGAAGACCRGPRDLQTATLDFEYQGADVRGHTEHLPIPLTQMTTRVEPRLENGPPRALT